MYIKLANNESINEYTQPGCNRTWVSVNFWTWQIRLSLLNRRWLAFAIISESQTGFSHISLSAVLVTHIAFGSPQIWRYFTWSVKSELKRSKLRAVYSRCFYRTLRSSNKLLLKGGDHVPNPTGVTDIFSFSMWARFLSRAVALN